MSKVEYEFFYSGPFSQWCPSIFVINEVEYNCAEQYMMAQKALYFGDIDTAECIMLTKSPRIQKKLGRAVSNFDLGKWASVAKDIVYEGNYAKFTQNKPLLDELLATYPKTLVEASPTDCVWGIGLSKYDEKRFDKKQWRGKNWLGEVLTKVRDDIMNAIKKELT